MFVASAYKGAQQKKLKDQEAIAYTEAADRRMAAATAEMAEERRKKEFMYSRALAVAGAQSGRTSDPGITTLLADLNAEGEYRILSKLWTGQTEAEGLRFRAEAARREGKAAYQAGIINGITSAVSSYASMGGFGGPTKPPTGETALWGSGINKELGVGILDVPGYQPGARVA